MNDTTIMPLKCLNCKKDIPLPWGVVKAISYTQYSYCEECLRKGLKALKEWEKVQNCVYFLRLAEKPENKRTGLEKLILETLKEVGNNAQS